MKIDSFKGTYEFLSNFYMVDVEFDGFTYPSTEHAYQAAKSLNEKAREAIRNADTCGRAKKMGQKVTLRKDWEDVKRSVMLGLLRKKFAHEDLKAKLLATGTAELVEGNWWGDTYWGVCKGKGKNWLGRLLMQVRDELKPVDKQTDDNLSYEQLKKRLDSHKKIKKQVGDLKSQDPKFFQVDKAAFEIRYSISVDIDSNTNAFLEVEANRLSKTKEEYIEHLIHEEMNRIEHG